MLPLFTTGVIACLVVSFAQIRSKNTYSRSKWFPSLPDCDSVQSCLDVTLKRLPQTPEEIQMKFHVYTKSRRVTLPYNASKHDIEHLDFSGYRRVVLIIHGFLSGFDGTRWSGKLKDLLHEKGYNVIGLSWNRGTKISTQYLYYQAVANTRVVGDAVAKFIQQLVEYGQVNVSDVHIIGHSLGAHVAGYIGEKFISDKIGRITGLDPAGPGFSEGIPNLKLHPSDALYTDILHTDVAGLGNIKPMGHFDFYLNGGEVQPGCSDTSELWQPMIETLQDGLWHSLKCNHAKSHEIFVSLLKEQKELCQFVGYRCSSYTSFKSGHCVDCGRNEEFCGIISFNGEGDAAAAAFLEDRKGKRVTWRRGRSLFLQTGEKSPFCLYHFHVIVDVSSAKSLSSAQLTLDAGKGKESFENMKLTTPSYGYNSKTVYNFLSTSTTFDGNITELLVRFDSGLYSIDPRAIYYSREIQIEKISLNYMSHIDSK